MTQAFAMALLVSTHALNYTKREKLLAQAGSALRVIDEPRAYAQIMGEDALDALLASIQNAEALQERLRREQVSLVALGDEGYPPLLAQIARPPHVLFVQGEAKLSDACPFAIVGTRQASEYGLRHTRTIARELARAGVCVVSGLALGIDAQAHMGALDAHGRTVAVLGGALDYFYPADNRPLRKQILESGGSIVSEFPMGMRPTQYSFLQRNRVIAGMCLGTLVTEGPLRSGAARTAKDALEENREVFALPGSVDSALSRLPNQLIAEGASVATCAADILNAIVSEPIAGAHEREVRRPEESTAQETAAAPEASALEDIPAELSEQERAVFEALRAGEMDFDALCEATGIPAQDLGGLLTLMEMDGLVEALAGARYALVKR